MPPFNEQDPTRKGGGLTKRLHILKGLLVRIFAETGIPGCVCHQFGINSLTGGQGLIVGFSPLFRRETTGSSCG
jgi:hypothetical protein